MVYLYDRRKQKEKYPSSHIFSKLMKYREEADYNPSYVFTTPPRMPRAEARG